MVAYPIKVTSIGIGVSSATTTLTAIEYFGDRVIGSGPGGDHVTPLTVPNTVAPIGVIGHHKWTEIVVGLAEDEYTAFYNTNVSGSIKAINMTGDNPIIGYLVVTEMAADGKTRTKTYSGGAYVANPGQNKITTEDGKYVVEVKLISTIRTVSAWA